MHSCCFLDSLAEMESDVLTLVMESLSHHSGQDTRSLSEMCHYLENNIEFCRLLINNNIDPQFPEKVFALPQVQQMINQVLGDTYNDAEYEYISHFLMYGAYQIIRIWINKEKRETPEEIADLILKQIIGTT